MPKSIYSFSIALVNDSSGELNRVGGTAQAAYLNNNVYNAVVAFVRNIEFRPGDSIRIEFPDGHPDTDTA